jgi:hypothetical protein
MRTITVSVQDEIMKLSSNNAGAAGSYNVVTLEISFGDAWDGMTKKLYFYDAHGKNLVYILLGSSNLKAGETDVYEVPIPSEPLKYAGEMTLTIKGITIDDEEVEHVIFTVSKPLKVLDSSYSEGGTTPAEPTETQTEQLMSMIYSMASIGLVLGGEYNSSTSYVQNTIVTYQGSGYVTLKAVSGITPTNDGVNYMLLVSKGDSGTVTWSSITGKPDVALQADITALRLRQYMGV